MPTIIIKKGDIDENGKITGLGFILIKEDNGEKIVFIGILKEDEKVFGVLHKKYTDDRIDLYIGDFGENKPLIRLDIKPSAPTDFYLSDFSQDPNSFLTKIARTIAFMQKSMQQKHPKIKLDLFDCALDEIEYIRKEMEARGMEGRSSEFGSASSQYSFFSCSGEEFNRLRRSSSDSQLFEQTPSTDPKNPFSGHYPPKLAGLLKTAYGLSIE